MPRTGVIAGSGFYDGEGVKVQELRKLSTPYGEPSDIFRICEISGKEVVLLSRHGTPHHIPPHMVNYRANLWGFRELGVERVFSVNAVGGISPRLEPGDLVIADQIIDMTHGRAATFYDRSEVVHIDFTQPFCHELRRTLIDAGEKIGTTIASAGTYICVEGPRLETRAEIQFFSMAGADIVGMTAMPEACLARELELCFACLAVVTNHAAGISEKRLTRAEVIATMKHSRERIKSVISQALSILPESRTCDCEHALKKAKL